MSTAVGIDILQMLYVPPHLAVVYELFDFCLLPLDSATMGQLIGRYYKTAVLAVFTVILVCLPALASATTMFNYVIAFVVHDTFNEQP